MGEYGSLIALLVDRCYPRLFRFLRVGRTWSLTTVGPGCPARLWGPQARGLSPWANRPLPASLAPTPTGPVHEPVGSLTPAPVPKPLELDPAPAVTPEASHLLEDPDEETSQAVKALREMADTVINFTSSEVEFGSIIFSKDSKGGRQGAMFSELPV